MPSRVNLQIEKCELMEPDLALPLERALETAASELSATACELGAVEAVVLLALARAEITHHYVSGSIRTRPALSGAQQDCLRIVAATSGPVSAATPVAHVLRETVLRNSRSFLLAPWPFGQRAVTVIFGFADPVPPHQSVSGSALAHLNLVGLATWSSSEILRLRTELKTVNGRLAGRKTVERAKSVLQSQQGFTEEGAYEYMRHFSRRRRITLAQFAEEVLRARATQPVGAPFSTVA
jgi:hypothetical protein